MTKNEVLINATSFIFMTEKKKGKPDQLINLPHLQPTAINSL